ncbi:MAG: TatD family hydrolase [Muribaculaceae bacterium]|nr:TatD family hydrolase [Muribaculaceae bacterium]
MTDTHTHLYLPEFNPDGGGEAAVRRAIAVGTERMVFPAVDPGTVSPMLDLARKFPANIAVAMGLHPTEVNEKWRENLATMMNHLDSDPDRYVAVGEVGIDLYWDKTFREEQMQVLDLQAAKARELRLPLIIHCRDGLDETLEVLERYTDVPAVFHSFGGTEADVERIRRRLDPMFGINGIVTFKNSRLGEVLPAIGAERIMLETDSPYLAPVPKRGRRNESAFLPFIAASVAQHLGSTTAEIERITDRNANSFFRLDEFFTEKTIKP